MRLKNIKLVFTLFFLSSIVVLTQANECKNKVSRDRSPSGQCNKANRYSFCELNDNSGRAGIRCGDNDCFCNDD